MKRLIAVILVCMVLLTACSSPTQPDGSYESDASNSDSGSYSESVDTEQEEHNADDDNNDGMSLITDYLDNEALLSYVEDNVYSSLVAELDSEDYFVENVEAIYYPKEYIEALASNTQPNIYFGYTSAELNEQFQGTKYVFTLGDNGNTIVVPMETVSDEVYIKAMEDVIVGSGVILICVTVSVVTAPAAPAVSMIFAASAATGKAFALETGVFSFAAAAIAKGYETESFDQAFKAGVEAGGKGFKWSAIFGSLAGGTSKAVKLFGEAKQAGFTLHQYAKIQHESGFPLDVIKEFHTMEEYQVFKEANLKSMRVGNKSALVKTDIDLYKIDSKGRTNLERMQQGLAPQDSNGLSYELHHVGQKKDGTLAILSQAEHDNSAIHGFLERTEAHAPGTNWDAERQAFWKAFAALFA
jgi:hypothetical protein